MTGSGTSVAVSTQIAVLSRMITGGVDGDLSNVCHVAAERALTIVNGACATVVLSQDLSLDRGRSATIDTAAVVWAGDTRSVPDAVFTALGWATVEYDAVTLVDDTSDPPARWSVEAAAANDYGIGGIRAYPIRAGASAVGALVVGTSQSWLSGRDSNPLPMRDVMGVQVLADLVGAAVMLSRHRSAGNEWSSRIEADVAARAEYQHAVGIVAERHDLDLGAATDVIAGTVTRSRLTLHEVTRRIIAGESLVALDVSAVEDDRRVR